MIHAVKSLPQFFKDRESGKKTFEVRKNDRGYLVGDYLAENEWTPEDGYSGKHILSRITYVLNNSDYCKEGFVILGLKTALTTEDAIERIMSARGGVIPFAKD